MSADIVPLAPGAVVPEGELDGEPGCKAEASVMPGGKATGELFPANTPSAASVDTRMPAKRGDESVAGGPPLAA